jgi:hypothetical protein
MEMSIISKNSIFEPESDPEQNRTIHSKKIKFPVDEFLILLDYWLDDIWIS